MRTSKKELTKKFIQSVGIDTVLQSMIEIMDDSIDAADYDADSIRDPKDVWKFNILEKLEQAYECYLQKLDNINVLENNHEN